MKRTLITLAMTLSVAAPAMADLALATSKNCMACHAVDKKMVGPSYKDVAAKYAGQKTRWTSLPPRSSRAALACGVPFPCPPTLKLLKQMPRSWLPG